MFFPYELESPVYQGLVERAAHAFERRIQGILDRMTLWPDWSVSLHYVTWDMGQLKCSLPPRPNSIADGKTFFDSERDFWQAAYVKSDMTDGQIAGRVLATFAALQEHECFEFVQIDGVPVISPHRANHRGDYPVDFYDRTKEMIKFIDDLLPDVGAIR